jgi:hypothetical protein
MAYADLSITGPTLSAYDPDNPTQATEELNLQLHNILQDMEDAGWRITDDLLLSGSWTVLEQWIVNCLDTVYDYAAQAIADYRNGDPISITIPTVSSLAVGGLTAYYPEVNAFQMRFLGECYKMMFVIYYLWKTEDDPLRIKDYIRDMLLAWPLNDITIDLGSESGSSMRLYPSWKGIE